jgi:hypothetical protein
MRQLVLEPVLTLANLSENKIYAIIKDNIIYVAMKNQKDWQSYGKHSQACRFVSALNGEQKSLQYENWSYLQTVIFAFNSGEQVFEFDNQAEFLKFMFCKFMCQ